MSELLLFVCDNAQLEIKIIEEQAVCAVPLESIAVSSSVTDNSTRVLK